MFSSSEFASPFIFYVSIKVLNFFAEILCIFGLLLGTFGFWCYCKDGFCSYFAKMILLMVHHDL